MKPIHRFHIYITEIRNYFNYDYHVSVTESDILIHHLNKKNSHLFKFGSPNIDNISK